MNNLVRQYLIEIARQPQKTVSYSDVVNDCKLNFNLKSPPDRIKLGGLLGCISEFEHEHNRPMLTSLVVHKGGKVPGSGYGDLSAYSGNYKAQDAVQEMQKCWDFWQKDENYKKYSPLPDTGFFTKKDLAFFKSWQSKVYDSGDPVHVEAKERLMNTVWGKSVDLGREIEKRLDGFDLDGRRYWSQRGWENGERVSTVKPYTWVKLFRHNDKGKNIFFTFGLDAYPGVEAFIYKIDCQNMGNNKLSDAKFDLFNSLIPESAQWNAIAFEELISWDLDSLIGRCVGFVRSNIAQYDAIVDAVCRDAAPALFANQLVRQKKPRDGYDIIPPVERNFVGCDVDFSSKAADQKSLGYKGEALVLEYERKILRNQPHLAAKVEQKRDGVGYDILSFDEAGNEKYIEVKTTTGNKHAPFWMSANEVDFMRQNEGKYCIYRLHNYNKKLNRAVFFVLNDNIGEQLLMQPTQYKMVLKKEA